MKNLAVFTAFAGCVLSTSVFLARPSTSANATIHPVVDARYGYLLGGSRNGRWVNDKETAKSIKGNESYRVYGLNSRLGNTVGSATRTDEAPCSETYWVRLRKNYNGTLAVGGNWNAVPRRPRPQNLQQRVYRNEVARFLKTRGLSNPRVTITQLWRVDLEGDGREEVLLAATHYKSTEKAGPNFISSSASAGDYSLVLLRKVTGRRVTTIPLVAEIYPQNRTFNAPNEHRLAGVLDANGDGKLEIALRSRYYEGDSVALLEVSGTRVKTALSAGCGA